MRNEGKFLVYCIEVYKAAKNMNGKQVINLFTKHGVSDYLVTYYDALHTTGENYIIEEIDLFMEPLPG